MQNLLLCHVTFVYLINVYHERNLLLQASPPCCVLSPQWNVVDWLPLRIYHNKFKNHLIIFQMACAMASTMMLEALDAKQCSKDIGVTTPRENIEVCCI